MGESFLSEVVVVFVNDDHQSVVLFGRWSALKGMKKTSSTSCLLALLLVQGVPENSTLVQRGRTPSHLSL